jgi:hypothetical protein
MATTHRPDAVEEIDEDEEHAWREALRDELADASDDVL